MEEEEDGGGGRRWGGRSIGDRSLSSTYKEKWSNIIDYTWWLLSDYPRRRRDGGAARNVAGERESGAGKKGKKCPILPSRK